MANTRHKTNHSDDLPDYYVTEFKRGDLTRKMINLEKGLGLFLLHSGVLENRVLLPEGSSLVPLRSQTTYRLYRWDVQHRRFDYDLEFSAMDLARGTIVHHPSGDAHGGQAYIVHTESGEEYTYSDLGVLADDDDITTILSAKPWPRRGCID